MALDAFGEGAIEHSAALTKLLDTEIKTNIIKENALVVHNKVFSKGEATPESPVPLEQFQNFCAARLG